MPKLRFITSLFGNRHVGMLLPLLYSITKSNPQAAVSVYWEDIDDHTIAVMRQTFPSVDWVETKFGFSQDITRRISSKMLVLNQAAQEKQNETGWCVFLDADMLILQDILPFLSRIKSGAVFTDRPGQFPINSGVVAFQASKEMARFFDLWLQKTLAIIDSPTLYAQANDRHLPYGGADQMALHLLLDYHIKKKQYHYCFPDGTALSIEMQPCEDLNETFSAPITSRTRIVHYKGGWRSILFENGPFTRNRPKKQSWDMFITYHRFYREAIAFLESRTGEKLSPGSFGLTTPFYFDTHTEKERPGLYPLFWLQWQVRNFFPRLRRYLTAYSQTFRKRPS